jgi:hypothetical protein
MNESSKPEQKQDHFSVLQDFFCCFHLPDIHAILYDWLVAALSTDAGAYNSGRERSNLLFVYERLLLLIEAAHEINKRRKRKRKRRRPHAARH